MKQTQLVFPITTALGLCGLFYGLAWLVRPDIRGGMNEHAPEDIAAVESDRDISFDPNDVPVLHQAVDYSEGEAGAWYPKGESPILAELVKEGKLPPVAERVGPEPAVMSGRHGVGNYGGTWYRTEDVMDWRMSGAYMFRWSPLGYPVMPHVVRDWEVSEDAREHTVHLRRGMRWSDGEPFTAADIIYHWEHEVKYFEGRPQAMVVRGELGEIEQIDAYTVRFVFPHPRGDFLEWMARIYPWSPEHYLRPYHPELGDPGKIAAMMDVQGAPTPRAAYERLKHMHNPEHPRLWPWVPRSHRTSPPYEYVRNPYYFVVDSEGNQLPYLDRVLVDERDENMLPVTAASGDITFQLRNIRFADYTLYMNNRERFGYKVHHWYPAVRSNFVIFPNLTRRVDPDRPETVWKNKLLGDKRFRQALSLAIHREDIIKAEQSGLGEPAQLDPGRESPFHNPRLFKTFTEYDPERANALLDEIGLTKRDRGGYRTFPDGTRMTFLLHTCEFTGIGPSPFLIEDWGRVGVRVMLYDRNRTLFFRHMANLEYDLKVWTGESEFYPLHQPRSFAPTGGFSAVGYANWYNRGGLYGTLDEDAKRSKLVMEPPEDHPLRRALEVLEEAWATRGMEEQINIFNEALEIAADNLWHINISTPPPQLVIVQKGLRNVPRNALVGGEYATPANAGIETYFFEEPAPDPRTEARLKYLMTEVLPNPSLNLNMAQPGQQQSRGGAIYSALLRFLIWGTALLFVGLIVVKHPFIARRCIILIPTLLVMSIVIFTVMDLPPGNFIEHQIRALEAEGNESAIQQLEALKETFHLEDALPVRYLRWLGAYWFGTFQSSDKGLLQGHLGMSMEHVRPVGELMGDRLLFSFMIAIFTIVFTWIVALPIGIYSAVRQYSFGDYVFTVLGFLGMSIPGFLLALVLMYVGTAFFGAHVGGLFSPAYAAQPFWTWGKVVDLLQHIWLPVVVVGTAGTAGMIRVMRANLLDELRKPYVITARAKGMRPLKLILKYPVRLALNPFVSEIGGIFPALISGAAIAGIVLSLPTIGPMQLNAIRSQDMYMAGSMLMVLSLLSVFGTLVSDLLLMALDPRIRIGSAGKK